MPAPRRACTTRPRSTTPAGVAFVVDIAGRASHDIVEQGLAALRNMEHRGASGEEPDSGDGAGLLLQVPDALYRALAPAELPPAGHYAVGTAFLPTNPRVAVDAQVAFGRLAGEEGLAVLCWRDLPVDPAGAGVGRTAASVMPVFRQVFLGCGSDCDGLAPDQLERRAYVVRKRAEHELGLYFPSLSTRTVVYKGMLTTGQLQPFFPDLSDPRLVSALVLVHSRFSTNTFPSWPLAHPYRYVAHNGEINTVRGNRNWMRAREALLRGPQDLPDDLSRLFPICTPGGVRQRQLRRGPRAAAHGRPVAAARGAHDGPRGVGERARDGPGEAGLLRVPRRGHGAVGRPGLRDVHRRHADRGGAGPQRAAAGPLVADRRRPGGAGQRGRGAGHRTPTRWCAAVGCSRAGCSWSTPRRAASSTTTRSRPSWPGSSRTPSGCTPA